MKKFFYFILVLILLSSCLFIRWRASRAQITGEGLTISPPLTELTLKPGETLEQTIKITNPTQKLMEVYPVVMNFHAAGETGEPAFSAASDESAKFSLANWIKFNQTKVALTSEQVVEFKYQIQVPIGAEPGGHYGVIFFATEPPKTQKDTNQVSISSMVGSLILVKIPGNIIEKGMLEEFSAKKFYFKRPVDFITRVSNIGNIHFKPKGEINISGWFSQKNTLVVNEAKGNVLPDSTRKFDNSWSPDRWKDIGRFTASLNLVYGENEKILSDQLVFWIIPWWLIVAVIVALIILFFLILWFRKNRKKSTPPPMPNLPNQGFDPRRPILR